MLHTTGSASRRPPPVPGSPAAGRFPQNHLRCNVAVIPIESCAMDTRTTSGKAPIGTRVNAAVRLIIEKVNPDQIILFGSAARGEMGAESDIDLLAIKEDTRKEGGTRQKHWECEETGDTVDVVIMERETAQRYRHSAYYVQGIALEEGRTVYARNGTQALRTGPTYQWNGTAMVKSTKFEPEHSDRLVEKARAEWETANERRHPADKCEFLQRTLEYALKALITAKGQRVNHTHDLNDLWHQAEKKSDPIAATRNSAELEKLTGYAGAWRYATPQDQDPDQTWARNRSTGEDVLNDALIRVPKLTERTRAELRLTSSGRAEVVPAQTRAASTVDDGPDTGREATRKAMAEHPVAMTLDGGTDSPAGAERPKGARLPTTMDRTTGRTIPED